MHCTACKVQGGSQIYGGAGRCHKQPHTAHPRRNKVTGGAHKKWKHTGTVVLDRAQAREESFPWFVQSSRLLLQSRSDRLRLQVQDWLLVVRWPHKGGRWSPVLLESPQEKMSVLKPWWREPWNGHICSLVKSGALLSVCMFTAETSRLSGADDTPCLHYQRRMLWIIFVVTRYTLQRQKRHFLFTQGRRGLVRWQGTFWQEDERRCRPGSGTETWDDGCMCALYSAVETAKCSAVRASPPRRQTLTCSCLTAQL